MILPAGAVARSHNLGQTLLANPVLLLKKRKIKISTQDVGQNGGGGEEWQCRARRSRHPQGGGEVQHALRQLSKFYLEAMLKNGQKVKAPVCKNIPVRFREWLAQILHHSAILGWAADFF